MGFFLRPLATLVALTVYVAAAFPGHPARAAAITYSSSIDLSSTITSPSSNPVLLNFSFPGYFTSIDSITIAGTFPSSGFGTWSYFEQFEFLAGPGGPAGYTYFYYRNTGSRSDFTLTLYPPTTAGPTGVTTVTTNNPTAFNNAIMAELSSTGTATIVFQPLTQKLSSSPSTFQLTGATLTVIGQDDPIPKVSNAPIPAGGLLFLSGVAVLWRTGRKRKPKS